MRRGGTEPTVTDADVVLGRIDVDAFAGGRVALDPGCGHRRDARARARAARSAWTPRASPMRLRSWSMKRCPMRPVFMPSENGKTLSERTLIAFGGAAPLHVGRIADKLGISRIIVPVDAGVGSAVGFLLAPISYEVARSVYVKLKIFRRPIGSTRSWTRWRGSARDRDQRRAGPAVDGISDRLRALRRAGP